MVDTMFASQVISAVSGTGLLGLAAHSVRRDEPAARSFAALLGVLGVAAVCGAATAHAGNGYKAVWLATTLTVPVAFATFAFDYYGLPYVDSPRRFAAAVTPAALGVVAGSLVLLGTPADTAGAAAPVAALAALPAVVFDVANAVYHGGIYYTAAVMVLAAGLVLSTVFRYRHLDTRLGPVVTFVGVWPWFAYLVMPELVDALATDLVLLGVAGGYAGSVLAAAVAVGPLRLFASSPAAGNVGPETVLDSMDDAVLVVDSEDTVLRLNAVASQTFGAAPEDAVGGPLAGVLGASLGELDDGATTTLVTADGTRQFDVTRSSVDGRNERACGSALLLRDVTRRQTREQRLDVLNRVLRHNLRNDANSIIGRARLISDGGSADVSAEAIVETTTGLLSAAERAREIDQMMTAPTDAGPTDVKETIESAVADVTAAYDVDVTTALTDGATAAVNPTVFETVVRNVVENAAEHNDADDPIVVVSGSADGEEISLAISDNGPGIPEQEHAVLERGEESALEHGSGLGLWAVYWGVVRMGGDLSFADNEPRGSVVTVSVPQARAQAGRDQPTPTA